MLLCDISAQASCSRTFKAFGSLDEQYQLGTYSDLKWLMDDVGCKLELVDKAASHNRSLRMLAEGAVDVMVEASHLPERDKFAWFSVPYRFEHIRFFALPDFANAHENLTVDRLSELSISLVMPTAGWFGPELAALRQHPGKLHILPYDDIRMAAQHLTQHRVELMIGTDANTETVQKFNAGIVAFGDVIYSDPVGFMFSKATVSAKEVDMFNEVIERHVQQSSTHP